ncbi:MAG TPA: M1 family aminopeptidase [Candidatus Acidoferrum sp.]|nr:M1 family aminopeptidase [Candidatus Acidoferrum sp.]
MPHTRAVLFALATAVCLTPLLGHAQDPPAPNSDPTYKQLRNITLGTEAVSVEALDLKRDAATFHLKSGTVCFVQPVQGKVTGAVFVGEGHMTLDPPSADERRSLKLLTKSDEFNETFQHLVLRFTDSTYEELKKAGSAVQGACDAGLLKDSQNTARHKLHYNLDARILEDVLSANPGGLFFAFVHGQRYDGKLLYIIDPNGARYVAPEQVELTTYAENNFGIWTAFPFSSDYRSRLGPRASSTSRIHIAIQQLDTTIESNAYLTGRAKTTFFPLVEGPRVLPFDLFSTLRVQQVLGSDGLPLSFVQEDKNDDPDFCIILPKPLAQGEKYTITTTYSGKDAVANEGNGNYYPVARENWYPANAAEAFGDDSTFDMTFRIPKGMKMAASGSLISEKEEGNQDVTEWTSDAPQPVAGFQFGRMKEKETKLTSPDFLVATYANEAPPDMVSNMPGGNTGFYNTVVTMDEPLSEAQFAIKLYTDYFGPLPFKRLSMTQQTACNYGQSWPDLVWLPMCSYYARQTASAEVGYHSYWVAVSPHEVAHQWWGQFIGFDSYRDQWMSEGFAHFSASLFVETAYPKKPELYTKFWDDQRAFLTRKNRFGVRAIDIGPVTMGFRLNNAKSGFDIYQDLIYPKGAYILQMLRMMMQSPQSADETFKEMMRDFVKTYGGRSATTDDFKAIVERHMTPDMKAVGSGTMDWFFNEYVYGTALPSYQFNANFDKGPSGDVVMSYVLSQSGVDDHFVMLVPIYLELADGRAVFLGRVVRRGAASSQGKITLRGVTQTPKRAMINFHDDILASN